LAEKAMHWIGRGVAAVWVIWPAQRELDVWAAGIREPHTLRGDAVLEGGDVVPGFLHPLRELW
jgi:hypothetical protein